jgi:hypothetical protein
MADFVSAATCVGGGERPRLHRAPSCAGAWRGCLVVCRREGVLADPRPSVDVLNACRPGGLVREAARTHRRRARLTRDGKLLPPTSDLPCAELRARRGSMTSRAPGPTAETPFPRIAGWTPRTARCTSRCKCRCAVERARGGSVGSPTRKPDISLTQSTCSVALDDDAEGPAEAAIVDAALGGPGNQQRVRFVAAPRDLYASASAGGRGSRHTSRSRRR